jgi:hypothetical protein
MSRFHIPSFNTLLVNAIKMTITDEFSTDVILLLYRVQKQTNLTSFTYLSQINYHTQVSTGSYFRVASTSYIRAYAMSLLELRNSLCWLPSIEMKTICFLTSLHHVTATGSYRMVRKHFVKIGEVIKKVTEGQCAVISHGYFITSSFWKRDVTSS